MIDKVNESEGKYFADDVVPILSKGIGTRISEACEAFGEKKRLSEVTGVSEAQLYRYIKETSSPTIEPLVQLARASGFNLDYLATGWGPKLEKDRSVQRFDVGTLQTAIETLEKGLEIMGRETTSPADKALLIAQVYEYLIDDSNDAASRGTAVLNILKLVR